jgi:tRNA 2-thiouridine synthesizing protein D
MAKTLTIFLRTGSMMAMDANIATKLARAAMDKGYTVHIFGYGEGVTTVKKGQKPKRFPNVGEETCFAARGFERGEEISTAKVGSLTNDLFKFIQESDRLVTIAR